MRVVLLLLAFLTLSFLVAEEAKTPYMLAVDKTMSTWPYNLKFHDLNYQPTVTERVYQAKAAARALLLPEPTPDSDDPIRIEAFRSVNTLSKTRLLRNLHDLDEINEQIKELVNKIAKSNDTALQPFAVDVLKVWRFNKLIP